MTTQEVLRAGIPGGYEWLIILAVVLIFFGNRIPGLARSLGSGITEFKAGLKQGEKDIQETGKQIRDSSRTEAGPSDKAS